MMNGSGSPKPAAGPVRGLTKPIFRVSLEPELLSLTPPQAASRGPLAPSSRPVAAPFCRKLRRETSAPRTPPSSRPISLPSFLIRTLVRYAVGSSEGAILSGSSPKSQIFCFSHLCTGQRAPAATRAMSDVLAPAVRDHGRGVRHEPAERQPALGVYSS